MTQDARQPDLGRDPFAFASSVARLCQAEPAARAALRRAYRHDPDDSPAAHPYLVPLLPGWAQATSRTNSSADPAHPFYAVAAWVARSSVRTSRNGRPATLGTAVRRAAAAPGANASMLRKRLQDLHGTRGSVLLNDRLPSLLTLLDRLGQTPHPGRLLDDLVSWHEGHHDRVLRVWLTDLYRRPDPTSEAPASASPLV